MAMSNPSMNSTVCESDPFTSVPEPESSFVSEKLGTSEVLFSVSELMEEPADRFSNSLYASL